MSVSKTICSTQAFFAVHFWLSSLCWEDAAKTTTVVTITTTCYSSSEDKRTGPPDWCQRIISLHAVWTKVHLGMNLLLNHGPKSTKTCHSLTSIQETSSFTSAWRVTPSVTAAVCVVHPSDTIMTAKNWPWKNDLSGINCLDCGYMTALISGA